ncbi:hypothetical protein PFISCL1PPCAC_17174, partial [Pristionchus fissidentatus]
RARGTVAARFRNRAAPSPARYRAVHERRFFVDKSVLDNGNKEIFDSVVESSIDHYRTTEVLIPFGTSNTTVAPTTVDPEIDRFFSMDPSEEVKRSIVPADFFRPANNASAQPATFSTGAVPRHRFVDESGAPAPRVIVDGGRRRIDGGSNSYGISHKLRTDKEWARKKKLILERIVTGQQKWHANVLPHSTDSIGLGPRKEGPEKRIKIFAVDGSTIGRGKGARTRVQHSIDETCSGMLTAQTADKPTSMHNRTGFFLPLSFNFKQRPLRKDPPFSASVAGNGPNIDTAAVLPPQFVPQIIISLSRNGSAPL